MNNLIGPLIAGLLTPYLPVEDPSMKLQLGLLTSESMRYLFNCNYKFLNYFKMSKVKTDKADYEIMKCDA